MNNPKCSIEIFKKDKCNNLNYSRQSFVNSISEHSKDGNKLLYMKTDCTTIETVCTYHAKKLLDKFSYLYGTSCCGLFSEHQRRPINLRQST